MSPARKLSDRHPFEVYLIGVIFASSIPAMAGVATPGSISEQLPGLPARLWAVALFVGSGMVLVGLAWRRPPFPLISVTGLSFEQVGLTIAGSATVVYAAAVVFAAGTPALFPAGLTLAFGLACFAQAFKIKRVLGASRRT